MGITEEAAKREYLDTSAEYYNLGWQGKNEELIVEAGFNIINYDDKYGFSQVVEDTSGNASTADSIAQSFTMNLGGGYSYEFAPQFSLELVGGYEGFMSSSRSIPNCSNCSESDFDMSGGLYVLPRVKFTSNNGFLIALAYHRYLSGDLESALALNIGFGF